MTSDRTIMRRPIAAVTFLISASRTVRCVRTGSDFRLVVAGREHEWHAAFGKQLGSGVDRLAAEVHIKDGTVNVPLRPDQAQRIFYVPNRSNDDRTGRRHGGPFSFGGGLPPPRPGAASVFGEAGDSAMITQPAPLTRFQVAP
jgi:hypothetical protein